MVLSGSLVLVGCDGWECGYGGPGCGTPELMVCNTPVSPGERLQALAMFGDDTGLHAAKVKSVSTSTPALIAVEVGNSVGLVSIAALDAGVGLLTLDVSGWKGQTFTWVIDTTGAGMTVDAGQYPLRFGGLADGGVCSARALDLAK